jgi:hypothetical protein
MILTAHTDIVPITPEGRESEIALRLARVGFDNVIGYVPHPESVYPARPGRLRRACRLTAIQLDELIADRGGAETPLTLDVRDVAEHATGHLPGSLNTAWRAVSAT